MCKIFSYVSPETITSLFRVNNRQLNKFLNYFLAKLNEKIVFIPCRNCSNFVRVKLANRERGNIFLPPQLVHASREMEIWMEMANKESHLSISNLRVILREAMDKSSQINGYAISLVAKDENRNENLWVNVGVQKCIC